MISVLNLKKVANVIFHYHFYVIFIVSFSSTQYVMI